MENEIEQKKREKEMETAKKRRVLQREYRILPNKKKAYKRNENKTLNSYFKSAWGAYY